jgi:D-alanyl-D-alanine carboxypeptidase/D-alanyl-D-alanine-endopeptidase (penicillin-binding protein 4)
MNLINRCRTVGSRSRAAVYFRRIGNSFTFQISGTLRPGAARSYHVTVPNPSQFLIMAFAHVLKAEGVEVAGKARLVTDQEPSQPKRVLHTWKSGLVQSIGVANKRSQNFYAEQILKTLGAETSGRGTFADGIRAIAAFHRRIGLKAGRVFLSDGCGLTRKNRAQPSAVCHVLDWMAHSPNAKVFRESFAVSGVDGTLRRRLRDAACKGRVAGKTGTIAGVSTLSGYVESQSGRDYAFSILCSGRTGRARSFQDAVCRAMIRVR